MKILNQKQTMKLKVSVTSATPSIHKLLKAGSIYIHIDISIFLEKLVTDSFWIFKTIHKVIADCIRKYQYFRLFLTVFDV